jgi:PAS domain S-box-containing protein
VQSEPRRAWRSTVALTGIVLACGVTVAMSTGLGLRLAEDNASAELLNRRTALAGSAVAAEARRYVDAVQSVAAAVGAQQSLDRSAFAAIASPLVQLRLPGATGVGFVVPAGTDDVAAEQRRWRAAGSDGLVLRPGRTDREHAFLVLHRSLAGGDTRVAGLDLSQRPEPASALAGARRTGRVAISDRYLLLGEQLPPPERREPSFLLAAPVYGVAADGAGPGRFRGWVTMTVSAARLVNPTLPAIAQGYLGASLFAVTSDGRRSLVTSVEAGSRGTGLRREVGVQVAQQRWVLRTEALSALLPAGRTYQDEVAFAALLSFTLLLAGLVFALGSGRSRAEARVAAATAALRGKQEYIAALVDTMDVIIVACDDEGRFTLVNRQAHELHGMTTGVDGQEWAATALTQFFATDGVTALRPDQLPLQRTLAEGEVHDLEFIVAAPDRPRRWLSAHGRRLHAPDGTSLGAVTAAHDITRLRESEIALRRAHTDLAAANQDLERSNDDLAAFAGLVSHDLKSPLASVSGYVDLLRATYAEGGEPEQARSFLDRVTAGVQRMRTLIDDLLAYATARNATPEAVAVDLGALIGEVVAARTDRAGVPGRPGPSNVYVAPMPTVAGDPAMLRQLLDNLIGNALKYVPPGRTARVDVTAEAERPGWVRVTVADRGIGIPDGQHEAIFESFHRAHRTSAYPGTGLGLAICHRVVTRHGGEIGARSNPGGGARIWFTLPEFGLPASGPIGGAVSDGSASGGSGGSAATGTSTGTSVGPGGSRPEQVHAS